MEPQEVLNKIEIELLNSFRRAYYLDKDSPRISRPYFFEKVTESLALILEISRNISSYNVEIRHRIKTSNGARESYYVFLDKKSIQRFQALEYFWSFEEGYVIMLHKVYDCDKAATRDDLLRKNICGIERLIKKKTGLIYEDEDEAFVITTGTLLNDESEFEVNITSASKNKIKVSYSYEASGAYLKMNIYYISLLISTQSWEILNKTVEVETYSMK